MVRKGFFIVVMDASGSRRVQVSRAVSIEPDGDGSIVHNHDQNKKTLINPCLNVAHKQ
jgi:hypothetical protein